MPEEGMTIKEKAKSVVAVGYAAMYGANEFFQRVRIVDINNNTIYPPILKNYLSNFAGTAALTFCGIALADIWEQRNAISTRQAKIFKVLSIIIPPTIAAMKEILPYLTPAARVSDPYDIVADCIGSAVAYISYKVIEKYL